MNKLKLLLTAVLLAASASTALADGDITISYTSRVGTAIADWNGSKTYDVTVTTSDGRTANMIEVYDNSGKGGSHTDNKVFSQTVTGLDNGTYRVTLFATAQNDWCSDFASNYKNGSWSELYSYDITDLFATSGDNTVKTPVKAKGFDENRGYGTPGEYTLDIDVTDGQLEMGMILNQTSMMDWFTIQIKSLELVVPSEAVNITEKVGKTKDDWHGNGTFRNNGWQANVFVPTADGMSVTLVENYHDADAAPFTADSKPMYQELTDLINGKYYVELYANANHANISDGITSDTYDVATVYAKSGDNTNEVYILSQNASDITAELAGQRSYSLVVDVTDGKLELGMSIKKSSSVNWCTMQIKGLYYISTDQDATLTEAKKSAQNALDNNTYTNVTGNEKSDLEAAITDGSTATAADISKLIDAFKAAATSYDSWVAAKANAKYTEGKFDGSMAKSALIDAYNTAYTTEPKTAAEAAEAATNLPTAYVNALYSNAIAEGCANRTNYTKIAIKNYDASDSFNSWTISDDATGAFSSVKSTELNVDAVTYPNKKVANYFDGWKGSDWTFTFSQTTAEVPAGKYRLAFISRAQKVFSEFKVNVTSGETAVGSCSLLPVHGNSGGDYGYGWDQHYVDFEITATGGVTISVEGTTSTSGGTGGWVGFTDFTLVRTDYDAEKEAKTDALKLLEDTDYSVIPESATERQELSAAVADDSTATASEVSTKVDTFKNAKESYAKWSEAYGKIKDWKDYVNKELWGEKWDAPTTATEAATAASEMSESVTLAKLLHSYAGAEGKTDFTNYIINPLFNDGTNGWTQSSGDGQGADFTAKSAELPFVGTDKVNVPGFTKYLDSNDYTSTALKSWSKTVSQTLKMLPAGNYRLAVVARAATVIDTYTLKVSDGENEIASMALSTDGNSGGDYGYGYKEHYLDFTLAKATTPTIAVYVNVVEKAQAWVGFSDFRLAGWDIDESSATYSDAANALNGDDYANVVGTERSDLQKALDANEGVNDAFGTFKAAKDNYDAYAEAYAKVAVLKDYAKADLWDSSWVNPLSTEEADAETIAALTSDGVASLTTSINDSYSKLLYSAAVAEGVEHHADFTAVIVNPAATNGINGWTTSNDNEASFSTLTSEPPTDPNGNTYRYFDGANYWGLEWVTRMTQTTPALPAGKYRLAVMARGASALDNYYWNVTDTSTGSTLVENTNLTHKDGGKENGDYGYGWFENYVDFTVEEGATVKIFVSAVAKAQRLWASITNFRLTRLDSDEDAATYYKGAAEAALADGYATVVGEERTALKEAVEAETIDISATAKALATFTAAKAVYDAYAEVYTKAAALKADAKAELWSDEWVEPAKLTSADDATTRTTSINNGYPALAFSYAVAEGREGTDDYTKYIENADASGDQNQWQTTNKALNDVGLLSILEANGPTDPDGNTYKYFGIENWGSNHYGLYRLTTDKLPIGTYRLAVMARATNSFDTYRLLVMPRNDEFTYTESKPSTKPEKAIRVDDDEYNNTSGDVTPNNTSLGKVNLSQIGVTEGGDYGYGWCEHFVDFTIENSDAIDIYIDARNNSSSKIGFTNFRLTLLNKDVSEAKTAAEAAKEECSNVTGEELTALNEALEGDDIDAIKEATKALEDAKESYDAYAEAKVVTNKASNFGYYDSSYKDNVAAFAEDPKNAEDAAKKANYDYKAALESAAVAKGSTYNTTGSKPTVATEWTVSGDCSLGSVGGSYPSGENSTKSFSAYTTTVSGSTTYTLELSNIAFGYNRVAIKTRMGSKLSAKIWVDNGENAQTEGADEDEYDNQDEDEYDNQDEVLGSETDGVDDINTDGARTLPQYAVNEITADGFGEDAGDYGNGWSQNIVNFDIIDKDAWSGNKNAKTLKVYLHVTVRATEGNSEEETPATVRRREASLNTEDSSDNGDNTFEMGDVSAVLVNSGNISTGVENVMIDANVTVNYENDVIYDLYGRRVANPGTGIYIVNGRKMVIKR